MREYPADHHILVIWNHGGGWRLQQQKIAQLWAAQRAEGSVAAAGMKAVSIDETDGDVLYMHEVWQGLSEAQSSTKQTLDIVGFDACLMGMIEVAYQIKDNAHFMVGSEGNEPVDGWPYHTILNDLVTSFDAREPRNLAKTIVQRYGEFYKKYGNGTETMAAYDLHQVLRVTDAINYFVETHNALPEDDKKYEDDKDWPEIGEARSEVEEFHDEC